MKLKALIGILVFLIVLNLATIGTFLFVQFSHKPEEPIGRFGMRQGMHDARRMQPRTGERMRLHADERKELRTLLLQFRDDTEELRARARDLEWESFELLQQDPVPKARVDSLLKEISLVKYEISKKATANLIEAKKVLAPEQQKHFFEAIHRSHMMMHGEHGEPGEPGRPGMGRMQKRQGRSFRPDSTRR